MGHSLAHCTHTTHLLVSPLFSCPGPGGEMPGRSQVEGCDVPGAWDTETLVRAWVQCSVPVHPVCPQDSPSIIVNTWVSDWVRVSQSFSGREGTDDSHGASGHPPQPQPRQPHQVTWASQTASREVDNVEIRPWHSRQCKWSRDQLWGVWEAMEPE